MLCNLLSALKRIALPEELHSARRKRLRSVLLNGIGKVVRHARETDEGLVGEARRRRADGARLALAQGPPALRLKRKPTLVSRSWIAPPHLHILVLSARRPVPSPYPGIWEVFGVPTTITTVVDHDPRLDPVAAAA